jgi:hypothetical protein
MLWIVVVVIVIILYYIHLLHRGRFGFWKYTAKYPNAAYDFFLEKSCWHVFVEKPKGDCRRALPPGKWDGPFRLSIPKLGGKVVIVYGKVPDYRTAQQEFIKRLRLAKSPSYLTIISEILLHHDDFHTHEDLIKHLSPSFFTDITNDPQMKLLNEKMPLPIGFNLKTFKFKESADRDGVIEAVFYEGRLVNFRSQLFLHGLNDEQVNEYMNSELSPLISDIVGTENFECDAITNVYHYDDFDGFIVAFRTVTGAPSLSVYITDRKYA